MSDRTITVIANTAVKAIVTANLKTATVAGLRKQERELREKMAQAEFQEQFYRQKAEAGSEQLNRMMLQISRLKAEVEQQLQQTHERITVAESWQEGQEILQTQVQTLAEIALGEPFPAAFGKEIVLRDGLVVEIRQGGSREK